MTSDLVRTLYRYSAWANARILDTATRLTAEQLSAPGSASEGAVRETLVHIMSAQWIWLARWNGTSHQAMLDARQFPDLGTIRARFIAPAADSIARILAKHAFLKSMTVPAGAYPDLAAPLASVGSWSFVLARPDLGDDVTYRLAMALHRGEAALARRLPQAQETTAANTLAAAPRADLIHRGVLRYLREVGLAR